MKKWIVGLALSAAMLAMVPLLVGKPAAAPKETPRRAINLGATPSGLPFSEGILVGDTLYIAGHIGLDPKTQKPPEDASEEARLVLNGIQAVLKSADMSMDDLVSVTVFCPDLAQYAKFNAAYRTYFKKDFPARAFIGSGPLLFGAKFEVMGIAVKSR